MKVSLIVVTAKSLLLQSLFFFLYTASSPLFTELMACLNPSARLSQLSTYKCTRLWRRLGDIFAFPFFPLTFILVIISSSLNKSLVIDHRKFTVPWDNIFRRLYVNDGGVCRAGYQDGIVCHCNVQRRGDGIFIQVGQSSWHGLVTTFLLSFFWSSGNRSAGVGTPWQFSLSNN